MYIIVKSVAADLMNDDPWCLCCQLSPCQMLLDCQSDCSIFIILSLESNGCLLDA